MPRYHFDLCDNGELAPDEDGLHLPDLQAAQIEAARSLVDIAKHVVWDKVETALGRRMAIEVREANGPVLQARFTSRLRSGSSRKAADRPDA